MARSLVVNHQEEPSTNPLLTGFLLLAVVWMLASAFTMDVTAAPVEGPANAVETR